MHNDCDSNNEINDNNNNAAMGERTNKKSRTTHTRRNKLLTTIVNRSKIDSSISKAQRPTNRPSLPQSVDQTESELSN